MIITINKEKATQHALAVDGPTGREKSRVQVGLPSLHRRRSVV
jgi:hypothetical protein